MQRGVGRLLLRQPRRERYAVLGHDGLELDGDAAVRMLPQVRDDGVTHAVVAVRYFADGALAAEGVLARRRRRAPPPSALQVTSCTTPAGSVLW